MESAYDLLTEYHRSGRLLSCDIDVEPWICELWPLAEVEQRNSDYEVTSNAPGYIGFGSNGGGEMFAISPSGAIVCLAFVGMSPREAMSIAESWQVFEAMLKPPVL